MRVAIGGPIAFRQQSLDIIERANIIINDLRRQGFTLTLRQLYYQFVARDWLANTQREYKRLGNIVSKGRLAGLIDWDAIEDRTRSLNSFYWDSDAKSSLLNVAGGFALDPWEGQKHRFEVWIEKDALLGLAARPCQRLSVPYFSCRGYASQTALYEAADRHDELLDDVEIETLTILHLGDHDPSGIDMTRDIRDRLDMFDSPAVVKRIALTMDQIEELKPPPNYAKLSDSRADDYIARYGEMSWELDALPPAYISDLITTEIEEYIDAALQEEIDERSSEIRARILKFAEKFE